jgi:DNA-binding SARP family transcriptional activator
MRESRLRLLGGFGLESSGTEIRLPVGSQRLMAFLALRGPSHRNVVAGTLWPEVPEAQALASLRTGVWRMNKLMPGLVTASAPSLSVSRTTLVDCREQEAFATGLLREHREDGDWLTSGLPSLWRGDLLPGWYDDWVVFERERLVQLRLQALERCARLLLQRDRLDDALQLALEAVRAEPLRESATATLMTVHVAMGNVSDALRLYDLFRAMLLRELGVQPSPRLRAVLPPTCGSLTRP